MTLEEALAVATVDDGPVDDVIKIDAQNKVILLPASEMLFGVEGEKDIERKYFKCPRIVGDNIDLYNHQIYINYVSAENKNGTFPPDIPSTPYWCDDVELDETGNYITFSWLLSGNVLTHPGFVAFAIVAKYVDGEVLKTRWKTTAAIGTVLMTVPDSGQSVAELYPDVITQLLQRMDEVEKAEEVRVKAETLRKSAETERASAETERKEAETIRTENETARKSAETLRQNAEKERVIAEEVRVKAETLRKSAETERASAETERKEAETIRTENETARKSAETLRQNAEKERVIAEERRVLAENIRKQNAEEIKILVANLDKKFGSLSFAISADDGGLDVTYETE